MPKLRRDLSRAVKQGEILRALVVDTDGANATVRLSASGALIHSLRVIGKAVSKGQSVSVSMIAGTPVVLSETWDIDKGLAAPKPISRASFVANAIDAASQGEILLYRTGSVIDSYPVDTDGLTLALLDSTDGDILVIPPCYILGDFTVPVGVSLVGVSRQACKIWGEVILSGENTLERLWLFNQSVAHNDHIVCVSYSGTANQVLDCKLTASVTYDDSYPYWITPGGNESEVSVFGCYLEILYGAVWIPPIPLLIPHSNYIDHYFQPPHPAYNASFGGYGGEAYSPESESQGFDRSYLMWKLLGKPQGTRTSYTISWRLITGTVGIYDDPLLSSWGGNPTGWNSARGITASPRVPSYYPGMVYWPYGTADGEFAGWFQGNEDPKPLDQIGGWVPGDGWSATPSAWITTIPMWLVRGSSEWVFDSAYSTSICLIKESHQISPYVRSADRILFYDGLPIWNEVLTDTSGSSAHWREYTNYRSSLFYHNCHFHNWVGGQCLYLSGATKAYLYGCTWNTTIGGNAFSLQGDEAAFIMEEERIFPEGGGILHLEPYHSSTQISKQYYYHIPKVPSYEGLTPVSRGGLWDVGDIAESFATVFEDLSVYYLTPYWDNFFFNLGTPEEQYERRDVNSDLWWLEYTSGSLGLRVIDEDGGQNEGAGGAQERLYFKLQESLWLRYIDLYQTANHFWIYSSGSEAAWYDQTNFTSGSPNIIIPKDTNVYYDILPSGTIQIAPIDFSEVIYSLAPNYQWKYAVGGTWNQGVANRVSWEKAIYTPTSGSWLGVLHRCPMWDDDHAIDALDITFNSSGSIGLFIKYARGIFWGWDVDLLPEDWIGDYEIPASNPTYGYQQVMSGSPIDIGEAGVPDPNDYYGNKHYLAWQFYCDFFMPSGNSVLPVIHDMRTRVRGKHAPEHGDDQIDELVHIGPTAPTSGSGLFSGKIWWDTSGS